MSVSDKWFICSDLVLISFKYRIEKYSSKLDWETILVLYRIKIKTLLRSEIKVTEEVINFSKQSTLKLNVVACKINDSALFREASSLKVYILCKYTFHYIQCFSEMRLHEVANDAKTVVLYLFQSTCGIN